MRDAAQLKKMIKLYQAQAWELGQGLGTAGDVGRVLAWFSCKVAVADLYEELEALRTGNVERIRPGVERRRKSRKQVA